MSMLHDNRTIDLEDVASDMINAAAAVVTGRLHLDSPKVVRVRVLAGDPATVAAYRFELARQFAAALLWIDPYVEAVFLEQEVPEGEELAAPDMTLAEPIRLFVVVSMPTPALGAAISALNDALNQAVHDLLPEPPHGYVAATIIEDRSSRLLKPRANGYRPAPMLLVEREAEEHDFGPR